MALKKCCCSRFSWYQIPLLSQMALMPLGSYHRSSKSVPVETKKQKFEKQWIDYRLQAMTIQHSTCRF